MICKTALDVTFKIRTGRKSAMGKRSVGIVNKSPAKILRLKSSLYRFLIPLFLYRITNCDVAVFRNGHPG